MGKRFAEALKFDSESTRLYFLFHWSGLRDRKLSSWSDPRRIVFSQQARQDEVEAFVEIPQSVADSTLVEHVETIVNKVFLIFNGYEMSPGVVEDIFSELLNRGRR